MRVTTVRPRCARVCAGPDGGPATPAGLRSGTRRPQEVAQPDQVIRRGGEGELPIHEVDAAMPELAQAVFIHPKTCSTSFRFRWLT